MKKFIYIKNLKFKGINFNKCTYGTWALQTITYGTLSIKHINIIKQYLQKKIKKFKQFKFNITLNKVKTKKPLDTRMGGGKSLISELQYFLKPGSIFLEFYNISENIIFFLYKKIINKIPIKIKLIKLK